MPDTHDLIKRLVEEMRNQLDLGYDPETDCNALALISEGTVWLARHVPVRAKWHVDHYFRPHQRELQLILSNADCHALRSARDPDGHFTFYVGVPDSPTEVDNAPTGA